MRRLAWLRSRALPPGRSRAACQEPPERGNTRTAPGYCAARRSDHERALLRRAGSGLLPSAGRARATLDDRRQSAHLSAARSAPGGACLEAPPSVPRGRPSAWAAPGARWAFARGLPRRGVVPRISSACQDRAAGGKAAASHPPAVLLGVFGAKTAAPRCCRDKAADAPLMTGAQQVAWLCDPQAICDRLLASAQSAFPPYACGIPSGADAAARPASRLSLQGSCSTQPMLAQRCDDPALNHRSSPSLSVGGTAEGIRAVTSTGWKGVPGRAWHCCAVSAGHRSASVAAKFPGSDARSLASWDPARLPPAWLGIFGCDVLGTSCSGRGGALRPARASRRWQICRTLCQPTSGMQLSSGGCHAFAGPARPSRRRHITWGAHRHRGGLAAGAVAAGSAPATGPETSNVLEPASRVGPVFSPINRATVATLSRAAHAPIPTSRAGGHASVCARCIARWLPAPSATSPLSWLRSGST